MKKICCEPQKLLYCTAIGASALLSWGSALRSVINPDGICYLLSAETIGRAGLHAAMHLCGQAKWPFFSLLIHGVVQVSHLSYAAAAYFLDGVCSILSVLTFICIIRELGGSRRVLWLAMIVILLAQTFNSTRQYIIRDHGFWAFYLLSFFFLLRYFSTLKWYHACAWSSSLIVATLFRIEGAIFLFTLPFLSWMLADPLRERVKCFFILFLPMALVGGVLWIGWMIHSQPLGRIQEIGEQLQQGGALIIQRYHTAQMAMAQHVLTTDSARDAGLVWVLTLMSWYVCSVMSNLSWVYGLLVIYAWRRQLLPLRGHTGLVVMGYLLVNIMITSGFMTEYFFLSKRYLIALSLLLMLFVPFALDDLLQKWVKPWQRIGLVLLWGLILLSSWGGVVHFGYSKSYIRAAGNWLAMHVPKQATLYVNDRQLMYYSRHFERTLFIHDLSINRIVKGRWRHYDYLALRLKRKDATKWAALLRELGPMKVQYFINKRGDQVVIYNITPSKRRPFS